MDATNELQISYLTSICSAITLTYCHNHKDNRASLDTMSTLSKDNCSTCNTHTPVQRPFSRDYPGEPERKVKPIWILLEQETVSGSGISWAACKSAPSSRQTTTPAPHHSVFLQAGCPSCRPTNSVKALKEHVQICANSTCKY